MKNIKTLTILLIFTVLITSCKKMENPKNDLDDPAVVEDDWVIKNINTTKNLFGIKFYNSTIGFIVGDSNAVFKTTNGGVSWLSLSLPTVNERFNGIQIIDSLNIVLSGSRNILRSNDGGSTWLSIKTPTLSTAYYTNLAFLNSTTGFVSGSEGLFKTSDAGATWINVNILQGVIKNVKFTDAINGWINSSSSVLKTNDGGQTWVNCNINLGFISTTYFLNQNIAVIASSSNGIIQKTINGGQTWQEVYNNPFNDYLQDFWYFDVNTAVRSMSFEGISQSSNGGSIWTKTTSPITDQVVAQFYFLNLNSGWAVGTKGLVLKYK